MDKKALVIGAGLGGLALANRLQTDGFRVTVLEKNPLSGGHAYLLQQEGYTWDMGPSLVTAPDLLETLFYKAGKSMSDYLELRRLDPFYRIYFHDKSFIDYSGDTQAMRRQMAQFNRRDAERYDDFIKLSAAIHQAVMEEGLGRRPFMEWSTMLAFVPRALRLRALEPCHRVVSRYFDDFRHRFIFSFHPLFIGGNPFRAPAVYLMIPYLEKTGGVHFSMGGMYSVVRAMTKLFRESGGDLHLDEPAREIVIKNGRVTGVQTAQGFYPADVVVSNADFLHTHRDLIRPEHRRTWSDRRLRRIEYGMSAVLLYLGIKKQYPQLLHHTLILSHRYKGLVQDIFQRKVLPQDFSMYLHAPTRTDPAMAPAGCESLYVLVPTANLQSGIDWEQEAEPFSRRILNFLEYEFGLAGLQEHLQVCKVFTPRDFQSKQNAYYGSAWGVEPRLLQSAVFRPHNRSKDINGLYLVGASTHPGAGLPGVLLTAEATESAIRDDIKPVI